MYRTELLDMKVFFSYKKPFLMEGETDGFYQRGKIYYVIEIRRKGPF